MNGVGYELGKELARRMGIPYEPVIYQTPKLLIEDVKSAKWDISFIAQDPDREKILDFTSVYLSLEHGYLVPSGSPIQMMSDLDKARHSRRCPRRWISHCTTKTGAQGCANR